MGEEDFETSGTLKYVMSRDECTRWQRADSEEQREAFLTELGSRIMQDVETPGNREVHVYSPEGELLLIMRFTTERSVMDALEHCFPPVDPGSFPVCLN